MNCVTNWTRWPQTVTSTEPRLTRGSSGRCSGTYWRLLRWVCPCQSTAPQVLIDILVNSCSPVSLYCSRRATSSLRPFALGQSAWPLTAGSERGHMMPSGSLWALGWTTTCRYLYVNNGVWHKCMSQFKCTQVNILTWLHQRIMSLGCMTQHLNTMKICRPAWSRKTRLNGKNNT